MLTFDDGPGAATTPLLMAVLAKHRTRATFFLLGRRAEAHPEIVDALKEAGHELACHTYGHLNAWKRWPGPVSRDIDRGYEALSKWVPANGLFRPPYGKATLLTRWQLARRGAPLVRWTHDSRDTIRGELPRPGSIVDDVMRDGGGIVLMHDFDRDRDAEYNATRAEYVLAVTDGLLTAARRARMPVMTAGELLGRSGVKS